MALEERSACEFPPETPRVVVIAPSKEVTPAGDLFLGELKQNGLTFTFVDGNSGVSLEDGPAPGIEGVVVLLPAEGFTEWAKTGLNPFVQRCRDEEVPVCIVLPDGVAWIHDSPPARFEAGALPELLRTFLGRAGEAAGRRS